MIYYSFVFLALLVLIGANQPLSDSRIVGGKDVDIKDFPYQLSLRYYGSHICGGSIISSKWALTSSHCVNGLGEPKLSFRAGSTSKITGGSIHQALQLVMHPKYNNLDWDYALVKVDPPFPIGESGVNAIILSSNEPAESTLLTVSGWGVSEAGGIFPTDLKAVDVHLVNQTFCNQVYGSITPRMICAADDNSDACQGDSGGPLVNKATGEQVGIVSWGIGCASSGFPGVYSNIATVIDWIKSISGV